MTKTAPEQNKVLVLEAFDTLFNKRDYAAAERFWSTRYIQHSAHIGPGREGLFDLIRSAPAALRYENQLIVAAPRPGLPLTSSASRTASSPSTGTSFRTKRPRLNPLADCRCSAIASRRNGSRAPMS